MRPALALVLLAGAYLLLVLVGNRRKTRRRTLNDALDQRDRAVSALDDIETTVRQLQLTPETLPELILGALRDYRTTEAAARRKREETA